MKFACLLFNFWLIIPHSLNAQIPARGELVGFVRLQTTLESQPGESIDAFPAYVRSPDGGTNTKIRAGSGQFNLVFDTIFCGQLVHVIVEKEGYEVVNKKSLRVILPENTAEQVPLQLYLCKIGQVEKAAARLYHINFEKIVQKQAANLASLDQQYRSATINQRQYEHQKDSLARELIQQEEAVLRLSIQFASADFRTQSERFRKAARYFSQGEVDSVLIALNEKEMMADLNAANKQCTDGQAMLDLATSIYDQAMRLRDTAQALLQFLEKLEGNQMLTLRGSLIDDENGRPIAGASIACSGLPAIVKSDSAGNFELCLHAANGSRTIHLLVRCEGFLEKNEFINVPKSRNQKLGLKLYLTRS